MFVLVIKDCKIKGLSNIEKDQIPMALKKVRDFFGLAASVDGKTPAKDLSDNLMGKASSIKL